VFLAIAEIVTPVQQAQDVVDDHDRYARIAAAHPALLYKHVVRADGDPRRLVDVMAWTSQEASEAFGIDPDFQRVRPAYGGPMAPAVPERSWINPGYYVERHVGGRTGVAADRQVTGFFHVAHGQERYFDDAARLLAADFTAWEGSVTFLACVNLGLPAWWCLTVQRPDAAPGDFPPELLRWCSSDPLVVAGPLVTRFDAAGQQP
jgi:hypothetical protein